MADRDGTREALLDAAIRLFGRHGYEAVSTRLLADTAGVNVAAIKYHFGSKDALYVGAIDALAALIRSRIETVAGFAEHTRSVAGNDPARQALVVGQMVEALLRTLLTTPILETAIPFVLRELFFPGPHFDRLYEAVPGRLHTLLTGMVAWVLRLDPESEEAIVRTHAVVGQIIIYHLGRPILLRRLQQSSYSPEIVETVIHEAKASILLSLGLPT